MGLINKKGYSYNDLTIIPEVTSEINSRSECNPFLNNTGCFLPIFAAPMASVTNIENIVDFLRNGITPIIPRNIDLEIRKEEMLIDNTWVALSLKEFIDLFIDNSDKREKNKKYNICVDIANGHMRSLYINCIVAKELARNNDYELIIMTGNIANSETYKWICENVVYTNKLEKYECAIDYIRVGIGGGCGCITSSNCSIHYPQASLIDECYKIKNELRFNITRTSAYESETTYNYEFPKIVADGGIRNYDHVIKALALGADYVMIGSIFAQCIESAGEKIIKDESDNVLSIDVNDYDFEYIKNNTWNIIRNDINIQKQCEDLQDEYEKYQTIGSEYFDPNFKNSSEWKKAKFKYCLKYASLKEKQFIVNVDVKFFGMASADGQKSISGQKTKTAEGITKYLPVKYTLNGWTNNMISYLRSAMSYTNCLTLNEFIGKPNLIINSISEINAVNK